MVREWKENLKGTKYLRSRGEVFMVWPSRNGHWSGGWKENGPDTPMNSLESWFATWEAAALALFDMRFPPRIAF